jgi:hypothetical protein
VEWLHVDVVTATPTKVKSLGIGWEYIMISIGAWGMSPLFITARYQSF